MNSIRSRRNTTRKVKTSPTPANIENLHTQNNWKAFRQYNSAFKGKQCWSLRLSSHRKHYSRLSQTTHHLKTTVINSNLSVAKQKTNSSNLNPATMKITTIHSSWMNSLMLYPNLMIQLLARMMSTTKCLNTSQMMLCSLYSTFLITSGFRENSLQAGVLLQSYQFLNLVKIYLTLLTIAQLLSQVAFAMSWSAWSIAVQFGT